MSTYAISDIHGAYKPYQALKAAVGYDSTKDELYILGDIFDGNTAHPEDCLKILDDVMKDDSITLLLGNHEMAHIEYYNACMKHNMKAKATWWNYLTDPYCGGKPLLDYFFRNPDKWEYYMEYLKSHAKFRALVEEKNRLYLLVHGSPIPQFNGSINNIEDIIRYDFASLSQTPTFKEDLYASSVIALTLFAKILDIPWQKLIKEFENKKYGPDDIYCIVGHQPTKYLSAEKEKEKDISSHKFQRVFHKNHIYDIDCGCRANSLNKSYDNSIIASDLCMMKLGKKPTFTYYSKIKER